MRADSLASRLSETWPGRIVLSGAAAIYAWCASGARSFSLEADVVVAVPVAVLLALVLPERQSGPTSSSPGPLWQPLSLLTLAAAAEVTALALGGHSRAVPSFSTVVDQALAWRAGRFALFSLWLVSGVVPACRRLGRTRRAPV